MPDIQSTFAAANPVTARTASTQGNAAAGALTSDFETFLLMLTTQLQNQDPLNPIESQDFAVQLATFSGVEQQVRTNQLLEDLAGGLGASGLSQLAGWVGMDARVTAPVEFSGAPVDIALSPRPGSDRAELIVTDTFGREVSRSQVPLGSDTLQWAATGPNGQPLPYGTYGLTLESFGQGQALGVQPVAHYSRIVEARQGAEGIELVIAGSAVVSADDVTGLRDPGGS